MALDERTLTVEELTSSMQKMGRVLWVSAHAHPFLIRVLREEEVGARVPFTTGFEESEYAGTDEPARLPRPGVLLQSEPERCVIHPLVKAETNPWVSSVTVGRTENSDVIVLAPWISKLHAYFCAVDHRWEVHDAHSSNGTSVNGLPLDQGNAQVVRPGDLIAFGLTSCEFQDAAGIYDALCPPGPHR